MPSLDSYALITIDYLKGFLGLTSGEGTLPGISVYHDESASATAATVQVTDTTVALIVTGGTNAGTSTLTLAAAANDTVDELVAVINALSKGWVAKALGPGDADTGDLVVVPATDAFGASKTQTLMMFDSYSLTILINAASAFVENYCNRNFKSRSYVEYHDGGSGNEIFLDQLPVTQITRLSIGRDNAFEIQCSKTGITGATVTVDGTSIILDRFGTTAATGTDTIALASYATIALLIAAINALSEGWTTTISDSDFTNSPSTDLIEVFGLNAYDNKNYIELATEREDTFNVDTSMSMITLSHTINRGTKNIRVDYTAGYSTVPADVQAAVTKLVSAAWRTKSQDPSMKSETIGDYKYERMTADEINGSFGASIGEVTSSLNPYCRETFA